MKVGGVASGQFIPVEKHSWTLPEDMEQQLSTYKALPKGMPPKVAACLINNTMGNFYGYTPADAAQDLKKAEGTVLLKYNDSITTITNRSYIRSVR